MANKIWKAACRPAYKKFVKAVYDCENTQRDYLTTLLSVNEQCCYGSEYNFSGIRSMEAFQKKVPLVNYEHIYPYIERIAAGEEQVLTRDDIILFEPTSGTGSGRKLIPYTATLNKEFQRGISPWIIALFTEFPGAENGRAYWSISPPQTDKHEKYGVIPVAYDSDWDYLGTLGRMFHSCIAVTAEGLCSATDTASFRNVTLKNMLAAADLALISVWSPSFLRLLLEWYIDHQDQVLDTMERCNPSKKARVDFLKQLGTEKDVFEKIWPGLKVISCWTDAASRNEARRLKQYFKIPTIQSKGLIATEAFVSFPFLKEQDPVLAVTSHFFEFFNEKGDVLLAHQVEKDHEYKVIVTTGGGLYRYCLNDRILVTGFIGNTPAIRFVGKSDLVSDHFGEKINVSHVSKLMDNLLTDCYPEFVMLAPDKQNGCYSYTLYIQTNDEIAEWVPERLEEYLKWNPHYTYCINIGQLHPARVYKITHNACAIYEDRCLAEGQRRGDIKLTPLSKLDGWSDKFEGSYVAI